jgi:hypothetical protein
VNTHLIYRTVDGEEIDQVRSERVLGTEANLLALALDEFNDFESGVLDIGHILAVAVFAEVARSADDNVEAVDTGLDGNLGVVEMASYVGKDLGFQLAH